jgi:hypothetical protein
MQDSVVAREPGDDGVSASPPATIVAGCNPTGDSAARKSRRKCPVDARLPADAKSIAAQMTCAKKLISLADSNGWPLLRPAANIFVFRFIRNYG